MNKKLRITMVLLALVTCIGVVSTVNVPVASADEAGPSVAITDEVREFGKGTLTAEGDGIAILGGRGIVDVEGNGILWIKDLRGDAVIEVTGYGEKKEFPDGWIQYAGFNGQAHVEGARIIVGIAGADIELSAEGRGRAILWGHGTYERSGWVNDQANEWSTRFGRPVRFGPARADVMPAA